MRWLRLLARNRFMVSPSRIPMAAAISVISMLNTGAALTQRAWCGRVIARTRLDHAPVFIIGHWRTGTTLMHELLALDRRFTYPSTYQCMAPDHFLVTQPVTRLLGFLLPERRPIDGMRLRWDLPQEDEFALCGQGLPSPYTGWAFPRRRDDWDRHLDPAAWSPRQRERWKAALTGFLQAVTVGDGRRLILKSPAHTARLSFLADLFPGASFVHMVRDPYAIVPSAEASWRRMGESLGLQTGCRDDLEDYLTRMFERMYRRFDIERNALGSNRIADVRYEDLIADPVTVMRTLYHRLDLPDFDQVRPDIAGYFERAGGYRTNRYEASPRQRRTVARHWADYARRYGYAVEPLGTE